MRLVAFKLRILASQPEITCMRLHSRPCDIIGCDPVVRLQQQRSDLAGLVGHQHIVWSLTLNPISSSRDQEHVSFGKDGLRVQKLSREMTRMMTLFLEPEFIHIDNADEGTHIGNADEGTHIGNADEGKENQV